MKPLTFRHLLAALQAHPGIGSRMDAWAPAVLEPLITGMREPRQGRGGGPCFRAQQRLGPRRRVNGCARERA